MPRVRPARTRRLALWVGLALVLAACGGASTGTGDPRATAGSAEPTTTQPPRPATSTTLVDEDTVELPPQLKNTTSQWVTDFTKRTIDLNELLVGIPALDPRDLIRPIDTPAFETVAAAGGWLEDQEPGVLVRVGVESRFYPLRILTRHEIVNDRFGDVPVAITYCPLCNTALAFDRRVDGRELRFGVSGLLRNSDLVMWDNLTESLWQQITGESIVGSLAGTKLTPVSSQIVRWADFAAANPDSNVLSRDQGFGLPYGANPYVGYSSRPRPYNFFQGDIDESFPALSRVVGVSVGEDEKAYPFGTLAEKKAVNDTVGGVPVTVWWGAADTADALDAAAIPAGQAVGTGVAYLSTVDGQTLTFSPAGDDLYTDQETASTWSLLGTAVDGPLEGTQLEIATHRNEFWFAWQAFFPDAPVFGLES